MREANSLNTLIKCPICEGSFKIPNDNLDIEVKLDISRTDPLVSYILESQKHNIEIFAAAYLEQTKIPPDKAVLVQQVDGNIIRWWFEEKRSD